MSLRLLCLHVLEAKRRVCVCVHMKVHTRWLTFTWNKTDNALNILLYKLLRQSLGGARQISLQSIKESYLCIYLFIAVFLTPKSSA